MKIHLSVQHGVMVLAPHGRITVETAGELTSTVHQLHLSGNAQLVVDFENVDGLDSCGLGAIAQAFVATWCRGGILKVAAADARTQRLFDVTALGTVIEMYPSVGEAIASFGPLAVPGRDEPVSLTVGG